MEETVSVLEGVRVVEFSQLIAAPFCGLTLLDLGAEVIKVEPPGGEPMRQFPPAMEDDQSALFRVLNRGKRSVVADLTQDSGRMLAARLIGSADVVLENLGDARDRTGTSFAQAAQGRPDLIWCAISGWGAESAGRAIDPSIQAATGMISITGEEDGGPVRIPVPLVDFMTGMYAVQSILVARWQAERGLGGRFLDCAMVDGATTLVSTSALLAAAGHFSPRRLGTGSPLVSPSGVFVASDGREVQIVCITERHWRSLCLALDQPDWIDDPLCADNSARLVNRGLVHARLAGVIASDTSAVWVNRISEQGGLCEHVRDIVEAWSDERLVARGLVSAHEDGGEGWSARMPSVSLANRGGAPRDMSVPALGADTEEVLAELESSRPTARSRSAGDCR